MNVRSSSVVLLGLGTNCSKPGRSPRDNLARAVGMLARDAKIVAVSSVFSTAPLGFGLQPRYLNAVVAIQTAVPPATLLRIVKRIEREAGRRLGRHWGPRPLDIDILDYGGRRIGPARGPRRAGQLLLPHPEMHRRAFVLRPLLDIAPWWRHPRLGVRGTTLLARLTAKERAEVRQAFDFLGP